VSVEELFRLEDVAVARKADPDTSHEAADSISSAHVWASQQAAIEIMRAHGKPMTAEQIVKIAEARELGFSASRMRSTPVELSRKGVTEFVGKTDPPRGRRRQLWALAEDA
jgi:hypothetical protein